ncbi:MAG: putative TesA-like protein protease [Parcubacteria group bacterium Gr01-1014_56]|nr:MAG: putative TesA-like protein protease [Parcubacteria group bacterium Gr01-1014_56]
MHILVFGDSITQGAFDAECGGWVNRLEAYCFDSAIKNDFQDKPLVFNLGISGDRALRVRARLESELQARRDSDGLMLVIFAVGINDSMVKIETGENDTPIGVYEKALQEMVDIVRPLGCQTLFVGLTPIEQAKLDPIPWNKEFAYRTDEIMKFDIVMAKVAIDNKIGFISMQNVFGVDPQICLSDALHPNATGHRLMFLRVKDYLEKEKII